MTRKITIRSTGEITTSQILDAETGEPIPNVFEVAWHHKAGEAATATLSVWFTEMDVEANAQVITFCPACRKEQAQRISNGEDPIVADVTPVDEGDWRRKLT